MIDYFVYQPQRILVVAAVFLCLGALLGILPMRWPRVRAWPSLAAGVMWLLYAAWEWNAWRTQANIRVDLLLIYPALGVLSLAAIVLSYRWRAAGSGASLI